MLVKHVRLFFLSVVLQVTACTSHAVSCAYYILLYHYTFLVVNKLENDSVGKTKHVL